ncbi:hypothetical protein F1880_008468 [Penicillium rolfsii]|nr:hypothetical protein F1880_008468 [Penicillium rolfsii]
MPSPTASHFSPLPNYTRHITTHDSTTTKSIIHSSEQAKWSILENAGLAFSVAYTTSTFPPNMNDDTDLTAYNDLLASQKLGLVNPGGTVLRVMDVAPNTTPIMHRTQSLDYGIVLEGEIEMSLDSGETRLLKKGDIAIQRGTLHSWRNPQSGSWSRMLFVLQESKPVIVNGIELREDLGTGGDFEPGAGKSQ